MTALTKQNQAYQQYSAYNHTKIVKSNFNFRIKTLIMQNRSLELVSPSEGFILLARRLGLQGSLQLEQIKAGAA
jgi:hypothetical protein